MYPAAFEYHAPASVQEALGLLGKLDEAKILAGGHSLVPMMKLRLAQPGHLVDLAAIAELRGIHISGGTVRIGAMTTQAALLASAELKAGVPLLAETGAQIADPQVRSGEPSPEMLKFQRMKGRRSWIVFDCALTSK